MCLLRHFCHPAIGFGYISQSQKKDFASFFSSLAKLPAIDGITTAACLRSGRNKESSFVARRKENATDEVVERRPVPKNSRTQGDALCGQRLMKTTGK